MGKTKVRRPRLLSLCSGIGGIDLAAEMAGWEIAGQCEIDDYCQRILARHWPDVKRVSDIRNVWGDSFDGAIDCIAAGFPCPPVSVAGKRRGSADARWLWPEVLRVIQIYEPAWTLLENVAGLISLGLDSVLADLDAAGYESWPVVFPAAAVGAPHQRERVFVMAYAARSGQTRKSDVADSRRTLERASVRASDGAEHGSPTARTCVDQRIERDSAEDVADTAGGSRRGCTQRDDRLTLAGDGLRGRDAEPRMGRDVDGLSRRLDGSAGSGDAGYPYQPWPVGPGQTQYPWEPPRTTAERIPNRAKRLTALGNAVVPQQVYPVLAAILATMEAH